MGRSESFDFTPAASNSQQLVRFDWNFGDPASGPANTASTLPPNIVASHTYQSPGNYTVQVTAVGPAGCPPSTASVPVSVPACQSSTGNGGENAGCIVARLLAVVLFALALLAVLLGICIPVLAPAIYWIAFGLAVAGLIALVLWLVLCGDKPCGWGWLLPAQVLLGAGWISVYFGDFGGSSGCCPWLGWVGVGLLLLSALFFFLWYRLCHPGWCEVLAEIAYALTGVVLPAIGYILSVPVVQNCVNGEISRILTVIAGLIATSALACKTSGSSSS